MEAAENSLCMERQLQNYINQMVLLQTQNPNVKFFIFCTEDLSNDTFSKRLAKLDVDEE